MFRRRQMMTNITSDIVVSDSFNRSDGLLGNAETGQSWSTPSNLVVYSNCAKSTVNSDSYAIIDSGLTDVDMTVTINLVDMAGLVFRYADSTLHYRFFMVYSTGQIMIRKGPYATPLKIVNLTLERRMYNVRIVNIGGSIRIYLDGVLMIEVSDSSYRTSKQGLLAARTGDLFDDYVIKKPTPFSENVIFEAYSLSEVDKTGDVNFLSCFPIVYGSTYKITFDYTITVKTAYADNMLIAIRNVSAFDYSLIRSIDGNNLGTHNGSVNYTGTALKNAGDTLTLMFRAYTGVADFIITNVKIEKVG